MAVLSAMSPSTIELYVHCSVICPQSETNNAIFFILFFLNGLCDGCVFSNVSKYNYCFSDFPFPEGANDYPHHTEMAQYIVDYAQHFKLPEIVHFRTHVVSITQKGQLLPHPSCQHHTERSVASAPKLSASHKKVSDFCTKDVSITHKGQLLLHQSCQHHTKRSVASTHVFSIIRTVR